ncbi:MAG: Exopolysaccharide biosynthesis polyprenyl glycosylphosphotransferase [Verrucomicrobiales bacterium]|nr:Exopolysaccharide biosynthesis polyprenyl glycosylphosphotransferase [Verrucomicrobiales bacterium]
MRSFLKQHWVHVTLNFSLDALIFFFAFFLATVGRYPDQITHKWVAYLPAVIFGSLFFPSVTYIFGLYAPNSVHRAVFKRALVLAINVALTMGLMCGLFYIKKSMGVARLVMIFAFPLAYFAVLFHHSVLLRVVSNYRERVAFIVTNTFDELEARLFENFGKQHLELVGLVHYEGFRPSGHMRVLGSVVDLSTLVKRNNIHRVLCSNKSIMDPAMCKGFCELRYSGIAVTPLISLFEEVHQMVPLELISPDWLLSASTGPHQLYITKIKRSFDIVASLLGLLFLGPLMLAGMAALKLTSRGPVFYKQTRCGRFGKLFQVIKLRSMSVDAEKDGAVWSKANDSRVTPLGKVLRKYRIDEIPQLLNVLRGEMSFVGPRPERPEFMDELAAEIPYFQERLMVQPGITGWAQVNYPYGASIEDARRKLEYDLYYTKNMGVFLDIFILLDTVRICLTGGVGETHKKSLFDTSFLKKSNVTNPLSVPMDLAPQTAMARQQVEIGLV